MLRGFYTAASGILTQERTLNVLTNNMANVNTPGFRASRVVTTTFEHEFLTRIEGENIGAIGKGAPIRMVSDVPVRFDPSMLEESGRPYDVALDGQGFFNIQATGENDNGILERLGELCEECWIAHGYKKTSIKNKFKQLQN